MTEQTPIAKHLDLLGHKVVCVVTGFTGIVTSVTFDLYGCIQAIVNPGVDKDGKTQEQLWFDVNRLKVVSKKPVMSPPDYWTKNHVSEGHRGPAEKPTQRKTSVPR